MFIIYLFGKDLYPANETANVQIIKRKTKNKEGSNRINKKTIKKTIKKRPLLLSLVTVGSTGIGMMNLLFIYLIIFLYVL